MSTHERRAELAERAKKCQVEIKFCTEGLVYILESGQFDRTFRPELLDKVDEALGALDRVGSVLMDAVNTMMMELD